MRGLGSPSFIRVVTLCGGQIRLSVQWEKRDLWVGAYWDIRYDDKFDGFQWNIRRKLYIWLCLVPMFPICLVVPWPKKGRGSG